MRAICSSPASDMYITVPLNRNSSGTSPSSSACRYFAAVTSKS